MLSEAAHTPVVDEVDEGLDIFCWRYEQFVELGHSAVHAHRLALSDADLGVARGLHRGGCAPETAFMILL